MNWNEELTKQLTKDIKLRRIFAIAVFTLGIAGFIFAMINVAIINY